MNLNDKQSIVPVELSLDFWLALQIVRNYVFCNGMRDYFMHPPDPYRGDFQHAMDVIDSFLQDFQEWSVEVRKKK